ncbi:NTP/NDP exchange transporter [Arenimonas composti]|uniref:Major facilitator superfamily (MFS) profile domain-containing protein n=1 Tax=Arenimonas composti TR7-09 = DSM 18010 TaxID=1121013 RepID=A0A091BAU7_9GAMM|nr:MFS transporter [Arenimonas composti]KFN48632.1 hypothetical protein P873_14125 [Arenimonas composti TR7-09 = DSM 18010]
MTAPAPLPERTGLRQLVSRVLAIEPAELPAVVAAWLMFLFAFTGYALLRPVRDGIGSIGGGRDLPWLFSATFIATLLIIPLFGAVASKVSRRRILPWSYAFFAAVLFALAAAWSLRPDEPWVGRAFYVWLSVLVLPVVSVAWSVLADLLPLAQAKRTFALMAAGISVGGLVGPLLTRLLAGPLGIAGLMVLGPSLILVSVLAALWLQRWRDRHPLPALDAQARRAPLGGNPFAGLTDVLRSPYLLGIALFVVLLSSVTTFLYFEQAALLEAAFPALERRTEVLATIDTVVQALALLTQVFLTGRIVQRLGLAVLLCAVPLTMAAGFVWLAFAPTFAVLVVVMVVRRAGEYALARPGRELLFTVVPAEAKYKAKNVIDTAVYRGADAVSGWAKAGIDAIAAFPALVCLVGAGLALAWGFTGWRLARAQQRRAGEAVPPPG